MIPDEYCKNKKKIKMTMSILKNEMLGGILPNGSLQIYHQGSLMIILVSSMN